MDVHRYGFTDGHRTWVAQEPDFLDFDQPQKVTEDSQLDSLGQSPSKEVSLIVTA